MIINDKKFLPVDRKRKTNQEMKHEKGLRELIKILAHGERREGLEKMVKGEMKRKQTGKR